MSEMTVMDRPPDVVEAEALVPVTARSVESRAMVGMDLSLSDATYFRISEQPVSEAQAQVLTRELDPAKDIDLRPDGLVYMGHHRLRQRLNEAFKPGGWALRRLTPYKLMEPSKAQVENRSADGVLTAEFALYAEGRFLSAARGEQKYQDNGEMTYGDACEGVKSNALSRCCKDLGIALDLWDRAYGEAFRTEYGVKVWVEKKQQPQWRLLTAKPFFGENGLASDSPNRDKYVAPEGRRRQEREDPRQERPTREPGDDDEPVSSRAAAQSKPANGGTRPAGRTITERQQKRLYAIAVNESGMTKDDYKEFLKGFGYEDDRSIPMTQYDEIVEAAQKWG